MPGWIAWKGADWLGYSITGKWANENGAPAMAIFAVGGLLIFAGARLTHPSIFQDVSANRDLPFVELVGLYALAAVFVMIAFHAVATIWYQLRGRWTDAPGA